MIVYHVRHEPLSQLELDQMNNSKAQAKAHQLKGRHIFTVFYTVHEHSFDMVLHSDHEAEVRRFVEDQLPIAVITNIVQVT